MCSVKLSMDASAPRKSIAVSGALARGQEANERADADADGNGLIRVFMDGVVGRFRACDSPVAHSSRDFFGVIQCGRETLAGICNFFSGYVGSGRDQGAGIFGEGAHIILSMFIHNLVSFLFVGVIRREILRDGEMVCLGQASDLE
jgi:hypothetical protein